MDNYKEYLEERLIGMYTSYDSVFLEGFNKNKLSEEDKKHAKLCKDEFLNYLEYKYDNEDVRYEIKSAKTDAEREKVAKKYAKDFEEWKKHNKKVNLSFSGMVLSIAMGVNTGNPAWFLLYFIFFGKVYKASKEMTEKRDEIGVERYNKKNKK